MDLRCRAELASSYKAGSQIARVVSEDWCARELYCAACDSNRLSRSPTNTPAVDFVCPVCEQSFQLKSLRAWSPRKIPDAAYDAMVRSIRADKTPNLLVLQYTAGWLVRNLLVIPRAFLSESALEKRAPLGSQARRAGWVGCNILLGRIPEDGKIAMVSDGSQVPVEQVRGEFSRVRRLTEVPPAVRGWTVDVLTAVRSLGKSQFSLRELYRSETGLKALHPANRNVRPKIRQQLQVLRDLGLVEFTSPGKYTVLI
jgi:type II restriction enzyme